MLRRAVLRYFLMSAPTLELISGWNISTNLGVDWLTNLMTGKEVDHIFTVQPLHFEALLTAVSLVDIASFFVGAGGVWGQGTRERFHFYRVSMVR